MALQKLKMRKGQDTCHSATDLVIEPCVSSAIASGSNHITYDHHAFLQKLMIHAPC